MKAHLKKIIILCAIAAVIALVAAGTAELIHQMRQQQEARRLQEQRNEVEEHRLLSFGNKRIGDSDLGNMTQEELEDVLQSELDSYYGRTVSLQVNDTTYEYTMQDFKESFYYECSDGEIYSAEETDRLAEHLVQMDKELDVAQQYRIITGEREPSECTVSIHGKINGKQVDKVIGKLADKYEIPVKNSHILKSGKITGTAEGRKLKVRKLKKKLKQYLKRDTKENYAASYETVVIEPTWFPKDLRKVSTVISEFTTTFIYTGSRGHNIQVGASRIDGICLLPGEKVSFDEVIHDDSDGQEFLEAGSYLNGQTVQTKGGGICQISTTAYNAVLRAGILPSKRSPHSMPVHYVPLGLDAAISEGVKDLEITNTLDVPIVIAAKTNGGRLTVQVISYANALKGMEYRPRAVQLSSKSAKAYLDTYRNGKRVNSLLLHTDRYQ